MSLISALQRHPAAWWALAMALVAGFLLAAMVTALLSFAPWVWTVLLIGGLLAFIPALLIRDPIRYWLVVFLLTTMVDTKKTLMDGLEVMDKLDLIAITPTSQLVLEIRLSDVVLVVLLLHWAVLLATHRTQLRLPRVSLLVLGLMLWSTVSSMLAMHPYLGLIEISNQLRYFVVFLYVVNNFGDMRSVVLVGCVLLAMLNIQSGLTAARFTLGFGEVVSSALGRTQTIDTTEHLNVVSGGGGKRAYGTVLSPRGTAAHLLLLLPWPLLVFLHSRARWLRIASAGMFVAGTVALLLTYSRSAFLGYLLACALGIALAIRWGHVTRRGVLLLLFVLVLGGIAAAPAIIGFINKRPDNVHVRMAQFKTAGAMLLDNFVLGVGPNNSAATQRRYAKGASSSEAVTDPTLKADIHPIHSQHLANLVELGIVGFALYYGFFVLVLLHATRLTHSDEPVTRIVGAGYLLGTCGLFVQFLTDPIFEHSVFVLLWFLTGLVEALHGRTASTSSAAAPPAAIGGFDVNRWLTTGVDHAGTRTTG